MWYVIQTMVGEEKSTIDMSKAILDNNTKHDFFIPEADRMKRFRGEWHKIRKPMFPGYVFISTDEIEKVHEELKKVPKLTKLLGAGRLAIPISEREEKLIETLTNKQHIAEMSIGYIEGDRLIVQEGPLMGMEALVKKIDRHKRTAILTITMFGNSTDVTMGLEVLRKG